MPDVNAFMIVSGLVLLLAGGELLVRGASRLAQLAGVPPLLIGLTVMAWGTSAPEAAVGIKAALMEQSGVVFGNVVGSNICNVLLILGLGALSAPLAVHIQLFRIEIPIMLTASLIVLVIGESGFVTRLHGASLMALGIMYMLFVALRGRRENRQARLEYDEYFQEKRPRAHGEWLLHCALCLAGVAMLMYGSGLLVDGATAVARSLGVSELVIGLTIVAIGTSLPELVTTVVAALKGHADMAVGNVVGSNIFNIVGVLGVSALVAPLRVPLQAQNVDLPVMCLAAAAMIPVVRDLRVVRWEGALFLFYYALYLAYLCLAAAGNGHAAFFGDAAVWLLVPASLVFAGWRYLRGN
jgi:cation:H+ antiporter